MKLSINQWLANECWILSVGITLAKHMKGLAGRGLMRQQQTIRKPVTCTGVGLHCGCRVSLTLAPAPPDTGIVFIRTDLSTKPRVPAAIANVRPTLLSTKIGRASCRERV